MNLVGSDTASSTRGVAADTLATRWDVIIIGGGAAGAAAALGLQGKRVLMLDVGLKPPANPLPDASVYKLRSERCDLHDIFLGPEGEAMSPIAGESISPKLKSPFLRFVTRRPNQLPPDLSSGFESVQSFALGGLANAWGAGVLRYNEKDLCGFPVGQSELSPLYDELTDHMGVNGVLQDDLTDYLGSTYGLQPAFELSPLVAAFLRRYESRRSRLQRRGVFVGRSRMAVLSKEHRGRRPYRAFGQDFIWGPQESIYSPLFTINELAAVGKLVYQPGMLVSRYAEDSEGVKVTALDMATDSPVEFHAKTIILAAGAINSARIVLSSHNDSETRLPLLDNPVSFVPAVDLLKIGTPLQTSSYIGGELLMVCPGDREERPIQGSVYGLLGPMRTDLLREFPLSLRGNLAATKYVVPGLLIVQVFYPDDPRSDSWVRLRQDGSLELHRSGEHGAKREGFVCKTLRTMGYVALESLCQRPSPGSSIHYAGCLPMRNTQQNRYCTDANGLLASSHRVFVADAATFPSLPAKNHTFTLMANALRIAKKVRSRLS